MKKVCDICGGSGQLGGFRGVSRFMITWEECPECLGAGEVDVIAPTNSSDSCDDDAAAPDRRSEDKT